MRIAITGAGGFVGGALARHFSARHEVAALTRRELDVTDAEAARRVVALARPDVVINCAVLGVDECERDAALAQAVNVEGARGLASAAEAAGAEFVQVSTNYVFGGTLGPGQFYTNADEARPVNEYGRTKLAGERAALEASPRCHVVRTSWVFGGGKENFFSTVGRKVAAGERVRAVGDVWASVTYVEDLAARVGEILARRRYATYQVVNAGVCSYVEFAFAAARLAGVEEAEVSRLVVPVTEEGMNRAPRPRRTPMRCVVSEELGLAPLRDWREALAEFLSAPRP